MQKLVLSLADVSDLEQALAAAEQIPDDRLGAKALSQVALALAQKGESAWARETLQRALESAVRTEDSYWREMALAGMVCALSQASHPAKALTAAEQITNKDRYARALSAVVVDLARAGDFDWAMTVADRISDNGLLSDALHNVALAAAHSGRMALTQKALREALAASERIEYLFQSARADRLSIIAQSLVEVGGIAETRKALYHELEMRNHFDDYDHVMAVASIGKAFARMRDEEGLECALAEIKRSEDGPAREQALASIVQDLAKAGSVDRAKGVAGSIGDRMWRVQALISIAQPGEAAQADDMLQAALAAAEDIGDKGRRAEMLAGVAAALAQVGKIGQAGEALQAALAMTEGIGDETSLAQALTCVAQALAQVGDRQGLQRMLAAAESIGDEWNRARALSGVAQALAQVGDREGLQRVLAATEGFGDDIYERRAHALSGVAQAPAQVGDREGLQRVLTATEGISNKECRAQTLSDVARALAQITHADDGQTTGWMRQAFAKARARSRNDVLVHIAAFAPVLAKLGIISATWDRLQAVEILLSGKMWDFARGRQRIGTDKRIARAVIRLSVFIRCAPPLNPLMLCINRP